MRTSEILDELRRLSKRERNEIRPKIADLDTDGWADADDPLSDADKVVIETRILAHDHEPDTAIPWEQFEEALKRRLGK
jgi:hypothetical protein